MKCIVIFLILVAASARLEAHAFLKDANPGVGSTIQTSPSEVRIRFTENIEPPLAAFRSSTHLGKKWTSTICIWIAPTTRCCIFLCRNSPRGHTRSVAHSFCRYTRDKREFHVPGRSLSIST